MQIQGLHYDLPAMHPNSWIIKKANVRLFQKLDQVGLGLASETVPLLQLTGHFIRYNIQSKIADRPTALQLFAFRPGDAAGTTG